MHNNPDVMDREPLDLRREQRGVYRGAIAALIVCALVLPDGFVVLPHMFDFPVDRQARLTFWAQSQIFVLILIVIGIGMVARGRRNSAADISGSSFSPPSPRIAIRVAFLQNTLEQAVIASGAYLALASCSAAMA